MPTSLTRSLSSIVNDLLLQRVPFLAFKSPIIIYAMYPSLQIPWSQSPSEAETAYRNAGLVRTQGTLFMLPPGLDTLISAYTAPPRPKSLMSSGATALCKHFERGGASSERGVAHPFWPLPKGSNNNKNQLAARILEKMLDGASWRNMMMLHQGVAVYEIRNNLGYGMRWTLQIEQQGQSSEADAIQIVNQGNDIQANLDKTSKDGNWRVMKTTFRGFLEPIEGMNHELPASVATSAAAANETEK